MSGESNLPSQRARRSLLIQNSLYVLQNPGMYNLVLDHKDRAKLTELHDRLKNTVEQFEIKETMDTLMQNQWFDVFVCPHGSPVLVRVRRTPRQRLHERSDDEETVVHPHASASAAASNAACSSACGFSDFETPQSRQTGPQQVSIGKSGTPVMPFHNKGLTGKPVTGTGCKGVAVKGMGKDIRANGEMQKAKGFGMKPGKGTPGGPGDQSWYATQSWQGKQPGGQWTWRESWPRWSEHSAECWDEGWVEVTDSWTQTEDRARRW